MPATKKSGVSNPRELSVALTNAGTLAATTTTQVASNSSLEEKVAMRIHSIEYYSDNLSPLTADLDRINFGFSFLSQQPSGGFTPLSPGVIDYNAVFCRLYGTAANKMINVDPFLIKNFANRYPEGGGVLVHPANLYWWTYCPDASSGAVTINAKVWYSMEDITQEMWDDLWKMMFVTQAG